VADHVVNECNMQHYVVNLDRSTGILLVAKFVAGRTMSLFQFMNFNWFQSKIAKLKCS